MEILAAVEQVGEALRIQPEQGRLLPEPRAALAIAADELGDSQLRREPHQQLLFLEGVEALLRLPPAALGDRGPLHAVSGDDHPFVGRPPGLGPSATSNVSNVTVSPAAIASAPSRGPEDPVASWGSRCPAPTQEHPAALPPLGDPARWSWLQRLRRQPAVALEPWLAAIEAGRLEVDTDLLAVLADRLDGPASRRLLAWWLEQPQADPALLARLARPRDAGSATLLRQALRRVETQRTELLLPLLGHQRDPADFSLLEQWVRAPHPARLRRAALEGLALGLPAWPLPPLRTLLRRLAVDLDPVLAATAVDLLARLPQARLALARLPDAPLDAAVERRRQRRLASLPAAPLVLVVHGRAGGRIPPELAALAEDLEQRRGAPVRLQSLTGAEPPDPAPLRQAAAGEAITLLPLLLLPGSHVRADLPAIATAWRASGPLRRLPFLGAWPAWQAALRQEVAELRAAAQPRPCSCTTR